MRRKKFATYTSQSAIAVLLATFPFPLAPSPNIHFLPSCHHILFLAIFAVQILSRDAGFDE
jgi:hypothetical protein